MSKSTWWGVVRPDGSLMSMDPETDQVSALAKAAKLEHYNAEGIEEQGAMLRHGVSLYARTHRASSGGWNVHAAAEIAKLMGYQAVEVVWITKRLLGEEPPR